MPKREDTLVRPLPDRFTLEATMKRRRRTQLLIAGITAVLLAGLGWALLTRNGDTTATPAPTATAAPSRSSTPASPPPSASVVPGSAEDLRTMTFQGATLPVSRTSGPYRTSNDLASGFAQTPLGAALAALHISARTSPSVGPHVFQPTIKQQTRGNTASFLAAVEERYETAARAAGITDGSPIPSAGPAGDFRGYRVDNYSIEAPTSVHILVAQPGTALLFDVPVTVRWSNKDWRLVPAPGAQPTPSQVASAAGYTPF